MQSQENPISTDRPHFLKETKNFFLDLIFPPVCIGCGTLINKEAWQEKNHRPGICLDCLKTINIQSGFACAFCNAAVINGLTCPFCRKDHTLSQLLVTANYEQPLVKAVLKGLKYKFMSGLGEDILPVMINYLQKQIERDIINIDDYLIVPVPLSGVRLRWRGFNQAKILADGLGSAFNLEVAEVLERTRHQKPQAEIKNKEDRIKNMQNVFSCISSIVENKDILLIDDISTTGSTLEECAKALRSAGASKIIGFVFARGL